MIIPKEIFTFFFNIIMCMFDRMIWIVLAVAREVQLFFTWFCDYTFIFSKIRSEMLLRNTIIGKRNYIYIHAAYI